MPTFGSISHGTLRPEDLLPAFADELRRCAREAAPHAGSVDPDALQLASEAEELAEELNNGADDQRYEEASHVLEELQDRIGSYACDYMYFGTLEGDGADFGWWIDWDALGMAEADGEVTRGDELPLPDDADSDYFLLVNDHGNATLYLRGYGDQLGSGITRNEWREVWGVV